VLILGQSANADVLAKAFRDARASATCRGFAVGRTIFEAPARQWLERAIDDATLVRDVRARFDSLIDAWREARGVPT